MAGNTGLSDSSAETTLHSKVQRVIVIACWLKVHQQVPPFTWITWLRRTHHFLF